MGECEMGLTQTIFKVPRFFPKLDVILLADVVYYSYKNINNIKNVKRCRDGMP